MKNKIDAATWKLALKETQKMSEHCMRDPEVAAKMVLDFTFGALEKLAQGFTLEEAFDGNPTDLMLKLVANQAILASAILGLTKHFEQHLGNETAPPRTPPFKV